MWKIFVKKRIIEINFLALVNRIVQRIAPMEAVAVENQNSGGGHLQNIGIAVDGHVSMQKKKSSLHLCI